MKSMTIHNMSKDLANKIKLLAKQQGKSQNAVIKALLSEALGLVPGKTKKNDLSSFAGRWSADDAKEFNDAISVFGEVDAEDWQ